MKRQIIVPAPLAAEALDELKQWLAISMPQDDALLTSMLRSALDMFEAFTGTMPLVATCEEMLPADSEWQGLSTRPVLAISGVEAIPAEGARYPLAVANFAVDLRADGSGIVRVLRQGNAGRIAVRFTAGLASDWAALPDAIRQGVIRLAAHYYRERDRAGEAPPAAITALWQGWRRMRLA